MLYRDDYDSPLGKITIVSDEKSLKGVYIEGQKYFLKSFENEKIVFNEQIEILKQTKKWLDDYFCQKQPTIQSIKLSFEGSFFENVVWKQLCEIPYGHTITYGELALQVAKICHVKKMSAQAIGRAVGHNPFSILVPCHRIIGKKWKFNRLCGRN